MKKPTSYMLINIFLHINTGSSAVGYFILILKNDTSENCYSFN